MNETQIKLLEAAELEFAEHGFEAASVRDITSRAGVNIASINYHFGSKEDLFKQMIRNRLEPINAERLKLLEEREQNADGKPLDILTVVEIIVRPLIASIIGEGRDGIHFLKAMGRGLTEEQEFIRDLHKDILGEVIRRFTEAIHKTLGSQPNDLSIYSMHFLSCSMVGAMMQHNRLELLSDGKSSLLDVNRMTDRLVRYIAGGILAIDEYEKELSSQSQEPA